MGKRVEPTKSIRHKSGHGHTIRDWRKLRGLSLVEASALSGISLASLSRVETGIQPYSQPILEALSVVLKCQPGDLLVPVPNGEDRKTVVRGRAPLSKKARDAINALAASPDPRDRKLYKILAAEVAV